MDTFRRNKILAVRGDLPAYRYDNDEIMAAAKGLLPASEPAPFSDGLIRRTFANSGVHTRHTSIPLERLSQRPFTLPAIATVQTLLDRLLAPLGASTIRAP